LVVDARLGLVGLVDSRAQGHLVLDAGLDQRELVVERAAARTAEANRVLAGG
jgi:hypothetical protein